MHAPLPLSDEQRAIRLMILRMAFTAHKGHIGSALSIADLLLATDKAFGSSARDDLGYNLVLSKGHAASAFYALLFIKGWVSESDCDSYCQEASMFGTHPPKDLRGVTFATGSLGQGIGFAVGTALSDALAGSTRRTVCVLSDAELDEGSTWEALLIAGHQRLSNLTVLLDRNGQQALGKTRDVLDTSNFGEAAQALGWAVKSVGGHDVSGVAEALITPSSGKPLMLLCDTTSGSGVSFMENRVEWHYLPMTDQQYEQALSEVGELTPNAE